MRKAFTLVELMVASLLLGMLVTALTMMFNQSSIAWRTGTASVTDLNDLRLSLGAFHEIRDEVLPGVGQQNVSSGAGDNREIKYRTVSLWKRDGDNELRDDRAFNLKEGGIQSEAGRNRAPVFTINQAMTAQALPINVGATTRRSSLFTVGVRSAGPDKKWETADDITTWPETVE